MLEQIMQNFQEDEKLPDHIREISSQGPEVFLEKLSAMAEQYQKEQGEQDKENEEVSEEQSSMLLNNPAFLLKFLSGQASSEEMDSFRKQIYENQEAALEAVPESCRAMITDMLKGNTEAAPETSDCD